MDHTFVICAYKESPFLEECIQSLLCQTIKSHILISTSTPNSYLDAVSKKYQIPIYVNDIAGGIAEDWNFGMNKAETPFVTIAHQDDIYEPQYAEKITRLLLLLITMRLGMGRKYIKIGCYRLNGYYYLR